MKDVDANSPHALLDALWGARMNRELERVGRGVAELRAAPPKGLSSDCELELELLEASLERAQGRFGRAQARFDAVARAFESIGPRLSRVGYHLRFQQGLQKLFLSRHSEALEAFLAALALAERPRERVWAGTNALVSAEYLGLSLKSTRVSVDASLREWTQASPSEAAGAWRDQLLAIEGRRVFRDCEWEKLFLLQGGGQLAYFQSWCEQLPFVRTNAPGSGNGSGAERLFETQFRDASIPWQGYRGRTLLGLLQPEDLEGFQPQELSDRLYLWVWQWMSAPDRMPFAQIAALLVACTPALRPRLGSEDFQQLRNALLWIGLFAGSPLQQIQAAARSLQPGSLREYAWYGREREWLERLYQSRDRGDSRLAFLDEPTAENFRQRCPAFLPRLEAWLGRGARQPERKLVLRVDLELGLVEDCLRGQRTVSESLSRCLALLCERRAFRLEELAESGFGLRNYEPQTHQTKLFNLLSRAKKLLPAQACVQVKDGVVLRSDDASIWSRIEVLPPHELASQVRRAPEWRSWFADARRDPELDRPATRSFPRAEVIKAGKVRLTRRELEALIGKSRATTNRQIAIWEKRGLLKRAGAARGIHYLVCGALTT